MSEQGEDAVMCGREAEFHFIDNCGRMFQEGGALLARTGLYEPLGVRMLLVSLSGFNYAFTSEECLHLAASGERAGVVREITQMFRLAGLKLGSEETRGTVH